jgi:hypothetical protein
VACRQPDTSRRDPRAGGQSEQGMVVRNNDGSTHKLTAAIIIKQILHAKKTNYRDELFARTIKAGAEMQSANRKILLRMRLSVPYSFTSFFPFPLTLDLSLMLDHRQQADLIVKAPKGSNHPSNAAAGMAQEAFFMMGE